MKIPKLTALIMAAACISCFAGCDKKSEKNSSEKNTAVSETVKATVPVVGGAELYADKYNDEKYLEKINEKIKDAEDGKDQKPLGSVGDVITPAEDSQETDLGNYRISSSGVKLYYDEKEFPTELMLSLDNYFNAISSADYTTYSSYLFPSYLDGMTDFLKKEYDYDMKTSFAKRCSGFANQMQGDYRISRIKLEPAEQYQEGKDNIESCLSNLDDICGENYYEKVKAESDDLIDACFYVMAEDQNGKETMLISECEIVVAVKDGKYYTFG